MKPLNATESHTGPSAHIKWSLSMAECAAQMVIDSSSDGQAHCDLLANL